MLLNTLPSSFVFLLSSHIFVNQVTASPLDYSANLQSRQQQTGYYAISGVQSGGVQPRLELRDLERNADQWNVYMLGMNRMQSQSEDEKLSWYQIAGIHGRPFTEWDSVSQVQGGDGGYCTHSSNLFPTWHRPYMALYEQVVYENCKAAVEEFPQGSDRDRYMTALQTFRIPYWDWAIAPTPGLNVMPDSMLRDTVDVVTPSGRQTISNPLKSYKFNPVKTQDFAGDAPRLAYQSTMRYPSTSDSSATSRDYQAMIELNGARPGHQSRIYHILTQIGTYDNVASDSSPDDSIESVHGNIHVLVGGNNGHMTDVPFAGFDPAFFLHHAMVDRLFALWQALYPDSYVTPQQQRYSTFTYAAGSTLDTDTPLMPFHSDQAGNFWTSTSSRNTSAFGYSYPELMTGDRSAVVASINEKYGPSTSSSKKRSAAVEKRTNETVEDIQDQYFAHVNVEKYGLNSSFSVFVFFGEPTTDPNNWTQDPNFVGLDSAFASSDSRGKQVQATGVIPLTEALQAKVDACEIPSMKDADVRPYLRDNMKWKIRKVDRTVVAPENVPDLKVAALNLRLRPAQSIFDFAQKIGGYNILEDVTCGLAGGLSEVSSLLSSLTHGLSA